jgi:hypothetical protein
VVVLDPPTSTGAMAARALDRNGKTLWTVAPARGVFAVTWSADGSRAIVQGQGGAIVVDGATGKAMAAGDGWIFERTNELPTAFPQNVEPGFDVDF